MILSITIFIHLYMRPMLKTNEGKKDRMIRIVLGFIFLGLAVFNLTGVAQIVAGVVGAIAFVTGIIGFCGIYKVLGISTLENK